MVHRKKRLKATAATRKTKADKTRSDREPLKKLSLCDLRTLERLAVLTKTLRELKPRRRKDHRARLTELLTAEDHDAFAKLWAEIRHGGVTEEQMRAHWRANAMADTFYLVGSFTDAIRYIAELAPRG